MAKFINSDGVEVEAFTQEELEAKIAEAKAGFETEIGTRDTALTELKTELETLKKANEGKKPNAGDKVIEDLQAKIDELTGTIRGNTKNELLEKLSGGDKDVRARLEQEYGAFSTDPTDKAAIEAQMLKAAKLAIPEESPSSIGEALKFASGRGSAAAKDQDGSPAGGITDATKEQGKLLGLSDADYQKYGGAVSDEVKS